MDKHRLLREYALMTLGTATAAVGIYFFKFPNHFSTGGVSGISILLGELVPVEWLTPATFNTIFNLLFLALGFLLLNKEFGLRTVYCSLFSAGLIQFLEWRFPLDAPLTDELLLELLFAIILPALGSGLLFNMNASTGGTDIAAMILKKYSGLDVGRALLCTDILIAASALWVFGITAGLCGLLGLALKSVLVDTVIESLNRKKAFIIVTSNPDVACKFIMEDMHRGATIWDAKGAYTHEDHQVVLTVLSRSQGVLLRRHLKFHDPKAFILVTNSSEIFGKGFLRA